MKPFKDTVPFSWEYYLALGEMPKQELKRNHTTYLVDDAAAVSEFLDAGLPEFCNGMPHYFETAVARRLTRLHLGCLGAEPGAFNAQAQFERCGRWHPTVGEIELMTDDELRAIAAEVAAQKKRYDKKPLPVSASPAQRKEGRVQLWEPCERCGAEPSYATPRGHLCHACQ